MKGIELKIKRIRAGLRQFEVAAMVGIPATKLCEVEAGRRRPSDELVKCILQAIEGNQDGQKDRSRQK